MKPKYFKVKGGRLPFPIFFPDATRGVVRTLDSTDIVNTLTPGVLVNTYHLYKDLGEKVINAHGGIKKLMNWNGAIISDSGGFQVMSLAKKLSGAKAVTDKGVTFSESGKKILLTPEKSIAFQIKLGTDLLVVLDDFTKPDATYEEASETVRRTLLWAKRSKDEFNKLTKNTKDKPYLIGVVQGGKYQDLRKYCTQELVKIGFDGLGYGGWPKNEDNTFDYGSAKTIADNTPDNYILYGLGIGKPNEIVECTKLGFSIFDCVLPTRDARHKRLYVFTSKNYTDINVNKMNFFKYYTPKLKDLSNTNPVSSCCDCLLCTKYSKGYLIHLFKINDVAAMRLATIHNLRFYSMLMEKIKGPSA